MKLSYHNLPVQTTHEANLCTHGSPCIIEIHLVATGKKDWSLGWPPREMPGPGISFQPGAWGGPPAQGRAGNIEVTLDSRCSCT